MKALVVPGFSEAAAIHGILKSCATSRKKSLVGPLGLAGDGVASHGEVSIENP